MKKKLSLLLAGLSVFGAFQWTACGDSPEESSSSNNNPVTEKYTFESLYSSTETFTLKANEEKKFPFNDDITGKNYVRLLLNSSANLLGAFEYCNVENPTQVVKEEFFIEPSNQQIEFKQFLDSYRDNGVGLFDKKMLSITLKNLDNEEATVKLGDFSVANRDVPSFEKEVYIQKGELKVGADLAMGGTLSYLERTSWEGEVVSEYIDYDNNVSIDVGINEDSDECATFLSSSVNLINICDAGREFQQSYYAAVGGTEQEATGANGYQRMWSYTAGDGGHYWPYNPVQGGDEVCNVSQIIDYEVSDNLIYVKVRAMDWGNGLAWDENNPQYEEVKNGRTTKSYIENWYTIKDGMLYVENRFIDWNGFTDMDDIEAHNLEIPAAYVVHPFRNYVCYTGNDAWNLKDKAYDRQGKLDEWAKTAYVNNYHPEDWFAWVNDNDFGVGVYIPGAGPYVSGRNDVESILTMQNNRSAFESKMANKYLFNKKAPTSQWTSCYVGNTDYTAPVVCVKMKEYVPLSYTYVVAVDYLDTIRKDFKKIKDVNGVDNSGLKAWDY